MPTRAVTEPPRARLAAGTAGEVGVGARATAPGTEPGR
jgi:hypothetical protein